MKSKIKSKPEITLESLNKKLTSIERKITDMQKSEKRRIFRGDYFLLPFGMLFLGIGLPLLLHSVKFPELPSVVFSFIFILVGFGFFVKYLYNMEQDENL